MVERKEWPGCKFHPTTRCGTDRVSSSSLQIHADRLHAVQMLRFHFVLCAVLCLPTLAAAQDAATAGAAVAPIVTRTEDGNVTVRATRITRAISLDGRLTEEVYAATPRIDGFLQQEPDEG